MKTPLEIIIEEVGSELDRMVDRGRHLSRRFIIELAVQRAYQLGRNEVIQEDNANMQALMSQHDKLS